MCVEWTKWPSLLACRSCRYVHDLCIALPESTVHLNECPRISHDQTEKPTCAFHRIETSAEKNPSNEDWRFSNCLPCLNESYGKKSVLKKKWSGHSKHDARTLHSRQRRIIRDDEIGLISVPFYTTAACDTFTPARYTHRLTRKHVSKEHRSTSSGWHRKKNLYTCAFSALLSWETKAYCRHVHSVIPMTIEQIHIHTFYSTKPRRAFVMATRQTSMSLYKCTRASLNRNTERCYRYSHHYTIVWHESWWLLSTQSKRHQAQIHLIVEKVMDRYVTVLVQQFIGTGYFDQFMSIKWSMSWIYIFCVKEQRDMRRRTTVRVKPLTNDHPNATTPCLH